MEFKKISSKTVKEWYIVRSIGLAFWLILCAAASVGIYYLGIEVASELSKLETVVLQILLAIPLGLLTVFLIIYAYVFPRIQYKNWKYRVENQMIELSFGVVFKHSIYVPFVRLQHIEIFRGIFDRIFGLSSVRIFTAGGVVSIPNLDMDVAEATVASLKVLISELDKEVETND